MKLHLVDGTYELFRNHFGAPPRQTPGGRQVGATLGLLRTLYALLTSPGVTHVGVAFDHVIESFRNGLYEGYKTSAGVDPDLLGQFSLAEEAVAAEEAFDRVFKRGDVPEDIAEVRVDLAATVYLPGLLKELDGKGGAGSPP